jgi:methionyl aminopeptidase
MSPQESYRAAGSIAAEALQHAHDFIREGQSVLEVCEEVEERIRKKGGRPAFPCNISQNSEAAHYTAGVEDRRKIEQGAVVKVDIGVHVEGYIADTAITLTFSPLEERMAVLNRQLLGEAVRTVRAGISVGAVADVVEPQAHRSGFRPISNLAGHELGNYVIHAGTSIPNVKEPVDAQFKPDTAYAIEPFLVPHDARGVVTNGPGGNIYRLVSRKRTKDERTDQLLDYIWEHFRSLPFSPRWVADAFDISSFMNSFNQLVSRKLVMQYPVLVEATGARVTQFEHTVFVGKEGSLVTTASP